MSWAIAGAFPRSLAGTFPGIGGKVHLPKFIPWTTRRSGCAKQETARRIFHDQE